MALEKRGGGMISGLERSSSSISIVNLDNLSSAVSLCFERYLTTHSRKCLFKLFGKLGIRIGMVMEVSDI